MTPPSSAARSIKSHRFPSMVHCTWLAFPTWARGDRHREDPLLSHTPVRGPHPAHPACGNSSINRKKEGGKEGTPLPHPHHLCIKLHRDKYLASKWGKAGLGAQSESESRNVRACFPAWRWPRTLLKAQQNTTSGAAQGLLPWAAGGAAVGQDQSRE